MSPLEEINQKLQAHFPQAQIVLRKVDNPNGFQFLNLDLDDFEAGIEWKPGEDFGVWSHSPSDSELDGLFDRPKEQYSTLDEAADRIITLVVEWIFRHSISRGHLGGC